MKISNENFEKDILTLIMNDGKCKNCPLDGFCEKLIDKYEDTVCDYLEKVLEQE